MNHKWASIAYFSQTKNINKDGDAKKLLENFEFYKLDLNKGEINDSNNFELKKVCTLFPQNLP